MAECHEVEIWVAEAIYLSPEGLTIHRRAFKTKSEAKEFVGILYSMKDHCPIDVEVFKLELSGRSDAH